MTPENLYTIFIAGVVLAMKPGPFVLSLSALAIAGKAKEIFAFVGATYIASTIAFFLFIAGVNLLEENLAFIVILLKAFTAAYFIWLGIQGFKNLDGIQDVSETENTKKKFFERSIPQNFIAGFLLSFSNPFFIIFVIGVIPSIINTHEASIMDLGIARLVMVLADFLVLCVYLVPLYFTHKLMSPKVLRSIRLVSNIAMILVGLYIGYEALPAKDISGIF